MQGPRPPVFDVQKRTNGAPAAYEESTFTFLNRVAGDFWQHPRDLIQGWCNNLADDEDYADVRARLRSGDAHQYAGALLELYVHELLQRTGHEVAVHPELPHTSRRPDFYAQKDGAGFYVEAVVPGLSRQQESRRARHNRFVDVINRLNDPNFILSLNSLTQGQTNPPAAKLRSELGRWLNGMDPDVVTHTSPAASFHWESGDWSADFTAFPLKAEARGRRRPGHRAIGVYAHEPVQWVDDAATIERAIRSKHSEYGVLGKPFVIAVGLSIHDPDLWHSTNTFYGHERILLSDAEEPISFRGGDGYFGAPPAWRHTNVSAVLLVNQLQPHSLHRTQATLWRHPGAESPAPRIDGPVDTIGLVNEQVRTTTAPTQALDFFGLPTPWPPGEPWPMSGTGTERYRPDDHK